MLGSKDDDEESQLLDIDSFYGYVVDFDSQQVIGDKPWIIKYFVPWCPHCKKMEAAFEALHHKY